MVTTSLAAHLRTDVRHATNWSIVISVLMILSGIAALVVPPVTGLAVTLVYGWLLVVSGALHLGYAFRASHAGTVAWEVLTAILYGAIGVYVLTRPVIGLEALTFALAICLALAGVFESALSFVLRRLPGSGWLLLDGIVTLLFAVMIGIGWPATSAWVIGTLVGLSMVFSGLTRLMLSVAVRQVVQ